MTLLLDQSSGPELKPLWLRLYQRYYDWHQRALVAIGICFICGWRRSSAPWSSGARCCESCYCEHHPDPKPRGER